MQIGSVVLILPVLFTLTATSKKAFNDKAAHVTPYDMYCCGRVPLWWALFVHRLLVKLLEWAHANHVFGLIYMAVVAFRSQLPVPSCGRSLSLARCVSGSSVLAHGSSCCSPTQEVALQTDLSSRLLVGPLLLQLQTGFFWDVKKILELVQIEIKSDLICLCSAD